MNVVPSAPPFELLDTNNTSSTTTTPGSLSTIMEETSDDIEKECILCFEKIEEHDKIIIIDCKCKMNKVCHSRCIKIWFKNGSKCPTCSENIYSEQIYSNYDMDNESVYCDIASIDNIDIVTETPHTETRRIKPNVRFTHNEVNDNINMQMRKHNDNINMQMMRDRRNFSIGALIVIFIFVILLNID